MGFLNKIFGSKVKVPKFTEIDPDKEIDEAFKSIQQRLPEGQRVARSIAEADTETALAVLEQFAPGSRAAMQQQMQNIQAGLRGELPEDVQRLITDRAAAQSFAGGFGGSGAARALELRDLGLTSLQRIDTAMNQSAQAFQTFRSMMPQRQSVGSMFLSPQDRINLAQSERNLRYQRDLEAAQERAKADPVTSGLVKAGATLIGGAIGGPMGASMGSQMFGGPSMDIGSAQSFGTGGSSFMTSLKGFGTRAKGYLGIAPSSTTVGLPGMQSSFAPGSGVTGFTSIPGF
jgi:hypothetical protein